MPPFPRSPVAVITGVALAAVAVAAHADGITSSARGLTSASTQSTTATDAEAGNDGVLRYRVPLALAASRGGRLEADLALRYRSTDGPSPFGKGWAITASAIELDRVGRTPDGSAALGATGEFTAPRFSLVTDSGRAPLVAVGPNQFRAEVESQYLLVARTAAGFETRDGWGTRRFYHLRQLDRVGTEFRWHLTDEVDGNGNAMRWSYRGVTSAACLATPTTTEPPLLARREWNNKSGVSGPSPACSALGWKDTVELVYDLRPDVMFVVDPSGAFALKHRVTEVRHTSAGARIGTYHLRYRQSFTNQRSLLRAIHHTGYACTASFVGDNETVGCPGGELPPTRFTYSIGPTVLEGTPSAMGASGGPMPDYLSVSATQLTGGELLSLTASDRAGMVDLDGDGRIDRLQIELDANQRLAWTWRRNRSGDPGRAPLDPFDPPQPWTGGDWAMPGLTDIVDVNGDGRPDHVRDGVAFNHGSGFEPVTPWNVDAAQDFLTQLQPEVEEPRSGCSVSPSPAAWLDGPDDGGTTIARTTSAWRDVTGDGVVDLLCTNTGDPFAWWVFPGYLEPVAWPPRGGFTERPMLWTFAGASRNDEFPIDQRFRPTRPVGALHGAVRGLVDVNGDGRLDYWSQGIVYLNTGVGFARVDYTNAPGSNLSNAAVDANATELADSMMDMNGDGLPDKVRRGWVGSTRQLEVRYNLGGAFAASYVPWLVGDALIRASMAPATWDARGLTQLQHVGLVDLDGDGLVDYVSSARGPRWDVHRNPGGPGGSRLPDLLVQIDNGVGGGVDIAYTPSTRMVNSKLPSVRELVTTLAPFVRGGLTPTPAATTIAYRDGFLKPHPRSRLAWMPGFALVTRGPAGGVQEVTAYDVNEPDRASLPLARELIDAAGCLVQRTSYEWSSHAPTNVTPVGSVRIPMLRQLTEARFEDCGQRGLTTARRILAVDNFGNALRTTDAGDLATTADDVHQQFTYATGATVVAAVARQTTCADAACARPLAASITRYDGVQSDDASALPEGQVERGNVKRIEADVYDLGDLTRPPVREVRQRFAYRSLGLVSATVDMLDATDGARTEIDYDGTWSLYPQVERRGLNVVGGQRPARPQSRTQTYDLARGLVLSEIDGAGAVSLASHDAFGRETGRSRVRGGATELLSDVTYTYLADGIQTRHRSYHSASDLEERWSRVDGLGRTVREWRPLGAAAGNRDLVLALPTYDALGRVTAAPEPHESNNVAPMTNYAFHDARGRVVTAVRMPRLPGGGRPVATTTTDVAAGRYVTRFGFGIDATGAISTVTDPERTLAGGAPSGITVRDARDRVVATIDGAGRRVDLAYDLLGHVTSSRRSLVLAGAACTGAVCNQTIPVETTMTWDSLGRRLRLIDPDRGTILDRHDGFDHVVRSERTDRRGTQVDAVITSSFDVLGRLETVRGERRVGGVLTADPSVAVTIAYDSVAGHPRPSFGQGRAAAATDAWGTTYYGYDEGGRAVYQARTVPSVGTHYLARAVDRQGRLTAIDYDGRETVSYGYNSAGWLATILGRPATGGTRTYWSAQRYRELGQADRIARANGAINELRDYDARTAMPLAIGATSTVAGTVLDLTYTRHDALGRLLDATDRRTGTRYAYGYDLAGQLTSARASGGAAGGQVYDYGFVYDSLGNLRRRTDALGTDLRTLTYADDGLTPHVATGHSTSGLTSARRLTHVRGNLVAEQRCVTSPFPSCASTRNLDFDARDRVIDARDASTRVRSGWDGDGARVWEEVSAGGVVSRTTHHLAGQLEIDQATGVVRWHIDGNGQRLLTRTSATAGDEAHYLVDRRGDVRFTLDATGAVRGRQDFLPFGKVDASTRTGVARYGFGGHEDSAAGLIYMQARFYDPELARFASADTATPSAANLGWNRYAYGYNDPINRIDPSGHDPISILIGIGISAGLGALRGLVDAALNDRPAWEGILIGALVGAAGGALEALMPFAAEAVFGTLFNSAMGSTADVGYMVGHAMARGLGSIGSDAINGRPVHVGRMFGQMALGYLEGSADVVTASWYRTMAQYIGSPGMATGPMALMNGLLVGGITAAAQGDNFFATVGLSTARLWIRTVLLAKPNAPAAETKASAPAAAQSSSASSNTAPRAAVVPDAPAPTGLVPRLVPVAPPPPVIIPAAELEDFWNRLPYYLNLISPPDDFGGSGSSIRA